MIFTRSKIRFFQLFCRGATMILRTLVSDQTACPVWQWIHPCRSNSTKKKLNKTKQKNNNKTRQYPFGTGEFWKPKETFLKWNSHFLFCCSNPAARLIVLLLSGNKSSTGLWSVREAHASRGRARTHAHPHERETLWKNAHKEHESRNSS